LEGGQKRKKKVIASERAMAFGGHLSGLSSIEAAKKVPDPKNTSQEDRINQSVKIVDIIVCIT
jgi:hypothetical protein